MPAPDVTFAGALHSRFVASTLTGSPGDTITTWADGSGNGRDVTQATGAKRPTLQTVTHNSKTFNVVRFDKIDDGLQSVDDGLNSQPNATIVIFKSTSTDNQRIVDSRNGTFRNLLDLVSTKWRMYVSVALSSTGSATANWTILVAEFNGTTSRIRSNGGTATAGSTGNTNAGQGLSIGIDAAGTLLPFGGDMVEVIRLNRLPTAAEIVEVDSYAQDTYGITVADYSGGASPVTGTAASTLPAFTQAATGTTTPPLFIATAASTVPAFTQTAAGAVAGPGFTATATSSVTAFTQAAAGTVTPPSVTATAAQALPGFTQTASGTVTAFTGTATSIVAGFEQAAAGLAIPPTYTATAASVLEAFTQAATGTFVPPWEPRNITVTATVGARRYTAAAGTRRYHVETP